MPTYRDPELEQRRDFVLGVGLFVLAAVVFLPSARFGFVNWDDPWYVLRNPLVKSWSTSNLYQLVTTVQVRNFAPLTMFSYLVDYTLWGEWAGGYHLTNTWLHAVNTVLVFALLRQLGVGRFSSTMAAALFAVHPVQVESVVWISARKGLLSGTFILTSLLCWLKPNRSLEDEGRGVLFLALALLCKAIAVVVPAIVLMYDLWIRRESFGRAVVRQFVPGVLVFCLLAVTMHAQNTETGGVRDHLQHGRGYLLLLDSTILWQYVGHLLVPTRLSVLYDPPTTGITPWIAFASASWLLIAWIAIAWRERQPWLIFGLASTFVLLVPVLNLFPITTLMNDRYLYLPSIPLFALFATGLEGLLKWLIRDEAECTRRTFAVQRFARGLIFASVAAGCLVGSVSTTKDYMMVWRDDLSLWQHARERTPRLTVVRIQLAMALHHRGHVEQAIEELQFAIAETDPDRADRIRIERKLHAWAAAESG